MNRKIKNIKKQMGRFKQGNIIRKAAGSQMKKGQKNKRK